MAFQQVPNTVEIAVHYTISGIPVINTYHARRDAGYNLAQLQALAAFLDANGVQDLLALQSVSLKYVKTVVRGLDQENDLMAEDNTNAGAGGVVILPLATHTAFCVQKLGGFTGRSARGRVYVGGIPASLLVSGDANAGLISQAAADAFRDAVETIRTDIEAGGLFNAVIVSRYHNNALRDPAITFDWVLTDYSDRELDTRRSRRR